MRGFLLGIAMAPVFIGLVLIGTGIYDYRLAVACRSWPAVGGEIIDAGSLQTVRDAEFRAPVSRDQYSAVTTYRYSVDGATHTATRIRVLEQTRLFDTSEQAIAHARRRYPVGTLVEVFYDPEDPTSAVLDPKLRSEGFFVVFAVGIFLVGLGFALGGILRRLVPARPSGPARAVCPRCQCEYVPTPGPGIEGNGAETCPTCSESA